MKDGEQDETDEEQEDKKKYKKMSTTEKEEEEEEEQKDQTYKMKNVMNEGDGWMEKSGTGEGRGTR